MTVARNVMRGASGGSSKLFALNLYTGNGSALAIDAGVNFSDLGGMSWIKNRVEYDSHIITDTVRGAGLVWRTDSTAAETSDPNTITEFTKSGFNLGADAQVNTNGEDYVAWSFQIAENFLDVATYTSDGASPKTVAHGLGVEPAMMIVKRLDSNTEGFVYHHLSDATGAAASAGDYARISGDAAFADHAGWWADTAPTTTDFTVGTVLNNVAGQTYAAYLFAHDPDNGIYCGAYDGTNSSGNAVTLGWRPQFVMIKRADGIGNWQIWDNQRTESAQIARLIPNSNNKDQGLALIELTPTGFTVGTSVDDINDGTSRYVFLAIRAD